MLKKCKNCGKEFKTYNSKRKFCSRKCFYEWLEKVSNEDFCVEEMMKDEEKTTQ